MTKKIILFTGARGVGKSTALASLIPATKEAWGQTLVVDTEDSWSDLVKSDKNDTYLNVETATKDRLKVGSFVRMYDRFKADNDLLKLIATGHLPWVSSQQKGALLDYYKYFIEMLDAQLARERFKYVLLDTIETPEAALTAWAEMNKGQSGFTTKAFGRFEVEVVRPLYENLIEGVARRGVEVVGLTSHLRQPWVDDKPVLNKVEPGGRIKLLARISTMIVWLVHEPRNADGAPAALVLKARVSKMTVEQGVLKPRRVLPERMPHFSWHDVEEYLKTPANFVEPREGERMSDAEREMISEMVNDEQMRLMILDSQVKLAEQRADMGVGFPSITQTDGEEGLSLPERLKREKMRKLNGGSE